MCYQINFLISSSDVEENTGNERRLPGSLRLVGEEFRSASQSEPPLPGRDTSGQSWRLSEPEAVTSTSEGAFDPEIVQSVWEFAEVVPGVDPDLWRKDEFGEWIYRLGYGDRSSQFAWEIFDPGCGRRASGVFAMRPLHWVNFLRMNDSLW